MSVFDWFLLVCSYENLKPPTSPIPTSSGYQKKPEVAPEAVPEVATSEVAPEAVPEVVTSEVAPEAVPEATTAVDAVTKIEAGSDVEEDPPQVVTSSSRSPYYV